MDETSVISCTFCDKEISIAKDFCFMEKQEKRYNNNTLSYHFVLKRARMKYLEDNCIIIEDSEKSKSQYFLNMLCIQCNNEIGKKFEDYNYKYYAFGKDKIKFGDLPLIKATDKWIDYIDTDAFSMFQRIDTNEFNKKGNFRSKNNITNSKEIAGKFINSSKRSNDRAFDSYNQGNTKDSSDTIENHIKQYSPQQLRHLKDDKINENPKVISNEKLVQQAPNVEVLNKNAKMVTERPDIGSKLSDRLLFLTSKIEKWSIDQILFEFNGPNKKNWLVIINEGIKEDMTGRLMNEVLKLLSHHELKSNPKNINLFLSFNNQNTLIAMNLYLQMGPLSSTTIQAASNKGFGSSQWVKCKDDALCLVEVICILMKHCRDCHNNPLIPMEALNSRVDVLLGKKFTNDNDMEPIVEHWFPSILENEKPQHLNGAIYLKEMLGRINGIMKAAMEAATAKANSDALDEEYHKLVKKRNRSGAKYLDDPQRDADYLHSSVVPSASELLSDAPIELPQNLVLSLSKIDHDEDDDNGESSCIHVMKSNIHERKRKFRNINHYLNTHYQLNREDCIAQLRRGLSAYRTRLNTTLDVLSTPSIENIRKIAKTISNSTDNVRMYIYENVIINGVDRMKESIGYNVSFQIMGISANKNIDWTRSSRFMNGSLLCLSCDGTFNEDQIVIATVLKGVQVPNKNNLIWAPTVTIGIDRQSLNRFNPILTYYMIESTVFFEAYRPVLQSLKLLGEEAYLPFSDLLLGESNHVKPPLYLIESRHSMKSSNNSRKQAGWDMSAVFPDFENVHKTKYWNPLINKKLPCLPIIPELDPSQAAAINLALSKNLAIIQGPPGTGKTFVGVLIAKLLLSNTELRDPKPILFICQTNHALDQMLELVYKFEPNMVRIGSRSESTTMQSLNISDRKRNSKLTSRRSGEDYEARDQMNISMKALGSALKQRGTVVSLDGERLTFPNCLLARLQVLLKHFQSGIEILIEQLVESSSNQCKYESWSECSYEAKASANDYKLKVPDWADDYNIWNQFPTNKKIRLMATYASETSPSQIMNEWKLFDFTKQQSKLKKKRPRTASSEWQEVGNNNVMKLNNLSNQIDELVSSNLENIGNIDYDDSLIDIINRDIDDNNSDTESIDSDYGNLHNGYNYKTKHDNLSRNEELVRTVIDRVVSFDLYNITLHLPSDHVWKISKYEKMILVKQWANLLNLDAAADVPRYTKMYNKAAKREIAFNDRVDSEVLRSAAVIGMTTNGAAKYNGLLRALLPEIIIVEEAAEVLEASIVAAFTPFTKHLILIGDHEQLRPQVSEYNLALDHGLEVSLFERLIKLGIPHVTLTTQRRMHPEICSLITPNIYVRLDNADLVTKYPPISGIKDRLFFITHNVPEDGQSQAWGIDHTLNSVKNVRPIELSGVEMSKTNSHEAKYLIKLVQYLLLNGYDYQQLVVLSMYKGQMILLRRLAQEAENDMSMKLLSRGISKVRITTTDNYQGEESDIVLLSLVRSNSSGAAGFVKVRNRICVALSRAKHGMYVIGNFSMFESSSELWKKICNDMKKNSKISDSLALVCSKHPQGNLVQAKTADDFKSCPNGGCTQICGEVMLCGHSCTFLCHPLSHEQFKCYAPCIKPRPINCSHPCKKVCWQICGPCPVTVTKKRIFCGHSRSISCGSDIDAIRCPIKCGIALLCGHNCPDICHIAGHDNLKHICQLPCSRTRLSCNHPCPKPCHERCGDCMISVRKTLNCGHIVSVPCSQDISEYQCTEICGKPLICGHNCKSKCGEVCDIECKTIVKKTMLKCDKLPRHWQKVYCYENASELPCTVPCNIFLPCGHKCEGSCCQCIKDCTNITIDHLACKQECKRVLPCNHKCIGEHYCGDNSDCPACVKPCEVACVHRKCELQCGEPCIDCTESCSFSCSHFFCDSLCYETHTLVPIETKVVAKVNDIIDDKRCDHISSTNSNGVCNEYCSKQISCGHSCLGMCGEVCPNLCIVCDPEYVHSRLKKCVLSLDNNNNDVPFISTKDYHFIQLYCGHSFEINNFEYYVQKFSNLSVLSCPECQQTAQGTYRYSGLIRKQLKILEPSNLLQKEKLLSDEVLKDLRQGLFGKVTDRLQSMISGQLSQGRFSSLQSLIYLLLGQTNLALNKLNDSIRYLKKAIDGTKSKRIQCEALITICICYLKGNDDDVAINSASINNLEHSINYLDEALSLKTNTLLSPSITTYYSRTSEQLLSLSEELKKEHDRKRSLIIERNVQLKKLKKQRELVEQFQKLNNTYISSQNIVPNIASGNLLVTPSVVEDNSQQQHQVDGGSALHSVARKGYLLEVKDLIANGMDVCELDDLGNTPLMCAAMNGREDVIEYLCERSPWHTTNSSNQSFLDIILKVFRNKFDEDFAIKIEDLARETLQNENSEPSHSWAASKYFDQCTCIPMDKLMDMTGIRGVKKNALDLYHTIKCDLKRPIEARIATKQALNFLFLGNPGTGKTTVARLFSDILIDLKIRESGAFVETSGQKLLQEGSNKFTQKLQNSIPGVMFIDEVYQLEPKNNSEGKAITNAIMEATENDRDKFTVIVAGYQNDVREKWIQSNPGIASRFPIEVFFDDFNEYELKTIFLSIIRSSNWQIEPYISDTSPDRIVDVSTVAARRLSRSSCVKGFANARSVRVMVDQAMRNASRRQKKEQLEAIAKQQELPPSHSTTLTLPDIIGLPIDFHKSPLVQNFMKMEGLDDVKSSICGLVELSNENYKSELRGEAVVDICLHRMFLGNPGTGKTTTAKLYGQLLNEMGYLSNGEVIIKGASEFVGEAVGTTSKKVNEILDSIKGKVLVIDEAYVLGRKDSLYGREALDTLVERVQGTPGEDFAVILCGYEEEMMSMLRNGNPGLMRRFRSEDAFHFADYNDDQLYRLLIHQAKINHLSIDSELALKTVAKVLVKQRAKPNFGNVGSINNLLDHAKELLMKRSNKFKNILGEWILEPIDLYEQISENQATNALSHLVNAENILQHIKKLENQIKVQLRKGKEPSSLLKNYCFIGSPGTGKTTVARAFGEVFHGLGLLSSNVVVECKAMELIAGYVGQSSGLLKSKMEEARGGILFIDEAYGLHPERSPYAKDVIEMLLSNMTDPKYQNKMIIILAGYKNDMMKLMQSNDGLYRRITEQLEFHDWEPKDCLDLLIKLSKDSIDIDNNDITKDNLLLLPTSLYDTILHGFQELRKHDGWGNAGDVITIFDKMNGFRNDRCDDNGDIEGPFTMEDINQSFSILFIQRPKKIIIEETTDLLINKNLPIVLSNDFVSIATFNQMEEKSFTNEAMIKQSEHQSKDYSLLLQEKDIDDNDIMWSALDEALVELNYTDLYKLRDIFQTKIIPSDVLELVAKKTSNSILKIKPMLQSQCDSLLCNILLLIKDIENEAEIRRLFLEEIQRANEKEKLRLKLEEEQRLEQNKMQRVAQIGKCCMGYHWIKQGNGYRCAGGSHYVSDAQLGNY